VGRCYKQEGHDAAVRLGHRLVSGDTREARIEAWAAWAKAHPTGALYCFRGGQRSQITQGWLAEAGVEVPGITGGYKALRQHLLNIINRESPRLPWRVVGGRTGVGKTRFLETLPRALDLEGLAVHRGSAFGPKATPQPTPINFENALAVALLRLAQAPGGIAIEDESRAIGRLSVPDPLSEAMKAAPLYLLEADLEARVDLTFEEYITDGLADHLAIYGEDAGFEAFATYLRGALGKIERRLGGARYQTLLAILDEALEDQARGGEGHQHRVWIETLLTDYYDPMYDYQLEKKQDRVVFSGTWDALREVLLRELEP
jgi:tRNA 2-selenouridine synthase